MTTPIEYCFGSNYLIFYRPQITNCDQLHLYDSNHTLVLSHEATTQTNWTQVLCLKDRHYSLDMQTTCQDVSPANYLEIYYNSEMILSYSLTASITSIQEQFSILFTLPRYENYPYYNSPLPISPHWYKHEFDSSDWPISSFDEPLFFKDITAYYRVPFTIEEELNQYNGYQFEIMIPYGYILYVNEIKVIDLISTQEKESDWKTYSPTFYNQGLYHK